MNLETWQENASLGIHRSPYPFLAKTQTYRAVRSSYSQDPSRFQQFPSSLLLSIVLMALGDHIWASRMHLHLDFTLNPQPNHPLVLMASGVRVFSSELFCLCWSLCTVTWSLCHTERWVSFPSSFILKQTDGKGFQVSPNAQLHWRPYIAWDKE